MNNLTKPRLELETQELENGDFLEFVDVWLWSAFGMEMKIPKQH